MSNVYVWSYPHENVGEALLRLDGLLAERATSLSAAFGRPFTHVTRRVGTVLIGQVSHTMANGVLGWRPWVDHGSCGVAWSGICEDQLGVELDEATTRTLHETALHHPDRIGRMSGNFLLISWSDTDGRVCVTTGDTMSPPLWWTSGPDGWACGSRAAPLFDLVAARPSFDTASAGLFIMSSFHVSGGTFFGGTERIGTRQRVIVERGIEPKPNTYLSVSQYLDADGLREADVAEAVRACADALTQRAGRQLQFSKNALVELSGGRDSRSVAAAIFRAGGKVTAHTGGAPGSPDVRIARSVADALGFGHSVETLEEDRLSVLVAHRDEARRWVRFSEGLETIRQGLHWERFFRGTLPVFENDARFFSGLHFGMLKSTVSGSAGDVLKRLPVALTHHAAAREILADIVASITDLTTAELGSDPDDAAWAQMFYWQRRGSIWGSNVMSVKEPATGYWLPLVDKTLMRWSWKLMREGAASPTFIDAITHHNAPRLTSIEFAKAMPRRGGLPHGVEKIWKRLRKRAFPARRTATGMTLDAQYFPMDPRRRAMWQAFFAANDHAWKDLVDERFVADLVRRQPQSQLLWNLATAELVAQEFF